MKVAVGFVAGVAAGAAKGVGALVCVWASAPLWAVAWVCAKGVGALVCFWASATVIEEATVAGSTAAGAVADAAGEGVVLSIPDCPRKGMKQVASGLRVRVVPNGGPRGW